MFHNFQWLQEEKKLCTMENSNLEEVQLGNEKQKPIIIQQTKQSQTNAMGVTGFVCSLLTFFFFWAPLLGPALGTVGFIFSLIGISKEPKGLAIAGLIISIIMLPVVLIFHWGWQLGWQALISSLDN